MIIRNSEKNAMYVIGEGTAILSSSSHPFTIEAEAKSGYVTLGEYETKKERDFVMNEIFVAYENNNKSFTMPNSTANKTNSVEICFESDSGLLDIFKSLMQN